MALATVAIVGMPPSCINSTAVEGTITIAALLRFRPSLSMFIARKRKAVGLSAYILAFGVEQLGHLPPGIADRLPVWDHLAEKANKMTPQPMRATAVR